MDNFIQNLEDAIEGTEVGSLTETTLFMELPHWDSIAALTTIAMIYSEYDAQITGDELMDCKTISDLFTIVTSKQKAA